MKRLTLFASYMLAAILTLSCDGDQLIGLDGPDDSSEFSFKVSRAPAIESPQASTSGNGVTIYTDFAVEIGYTHDGVNWFQGSTDRRVWKLFDAVHARGRFYVPVQSLVDGEPDGVLFESLDGQRWSTIATIYDDLFMSIVDADTSIISVTLRNRVMVSRDMHAWTRVESNLDTLLSINPHEHLYTVRMIDSGFLGIGTKGSIVVSADAVNWKLIREGRQDGVVPLVNSGSEIFYTSDGTRLTLRSDSLFEELTNLTWTPRSVCVFGGVIYACGAGGVAFSLDGLTFGSSLQSPDPLTGDTLDLRILQDHGGQLFAFGRYGLIYRSSGSHDWLQLANKGREVFTDVIWGDDQFIAQSTGNYVFKSRDGAEWEKIRLESDHRMQSLCWTGSFYVGVNNRKNPSTAFVSQDALNWRAIDLTKIGVPENMRFWLARADRRKIVLAGDCLVTLDGERGNISDPKIHCLDGLVSRFNDFLFTNEKFVAVGLSAKLGEGASGVVVVCDREGEVRSETILPSDEFKGIAWSGRDYLIVSRRGKAFHSTDGENWSFVREFYGGGFVVNDVAWIGNAFLTVGSGDFLITTKDFSNWVNHYLGFEGDYLRIAAHQDNSVVSGVGSLILVR